ncbi:SDR family oxidoreductase [Paenibacillus qinlingensis]|uniref:SDR family oxidoreductase n=1 Tax=Paenibacillus qinlingensis TaxID=1837343 RepID=UPI0015670866|nr:SDR family oxidoreductase [Paenibacillus qinlingensis]NQX57962.1 SDR family oxidoreductase [Paenibacillus qinlingensis]
MTASVVDSAHSLPPLNVLQRFHVVTVPAPLPGFEIAGLREHPVYIWDDGTSLTVTLAGKLKANGVEAVVTSSFPEGARQVIFLGIAYSQDDRETSLALNRDAFLAAKQVAPVMERDGGFFLIVQGLGGDFGLSGNQGERVWSAGLSALAKTASKEWPLALVKAVDVDPTASVESLVDCIINELFAGGLEKEIGYGADGVRMALGMELSPQQPSEGSTLLPHDVVLVSGGARGVTSDSLIALAEQVPLRFILLGRTALEDPVEGISGTESEQELSKLLFERARERGESLTPIALKKLIQQLRSAQEVRETIRRLEHTGSLVQYVPVDITDKAALQDALAPVRLAWGGIQGIVHGAGILADKRLKDKKPEQFDQVFATKVQGLQTLLEVTQGDNLKLIVMFSSVAAREGNVGQSDYAMANEILNRVARQLKKRHGRAIVKSLNWGPWDGGMVTESLRKHFQSQGIALIPKDAGSQLFANEAYTVNPDDVEIVIGGISAETPSFISNQQRTFRMNLLVDTVVYPFLQDHVIGEAAVIPIVWVQEWMHRLSQSLYPDLVVSSITDLRVLKGVRLDPVGCPSVMLSFSGTETYNAEDRSIRLKLTVVDEQGTLHYSGESVLLSRYEVRPLSAGALEQPSEEWSLRSEMIYGEYLFHGPAFQEIQKLDACDGEQATATLRVNLADAHSSTAPMMLDGGLQLVRLWGYQHYARPSLPMRIGRSSWRATGHANGQELSCRIRVRRQSESKLVADATFMDSLGECVVLMEEIEMYFIDERRNV